MPGALFFILAQSVGKKFPISNHFWHAIIRG